ncbi:MAG TPA: hypothetical protein V6C78_33505 [Crinalium sp.]|jgi:hypothetical protein
MKGMKLWVFLLPIGVVGFGLLTLLLLRLNFNVQVEPIPDTKPVPSANQPTPTTSPTVTDSPRPSPVTPSPNPSASQSPPEILPNGKVHTGTLRVSNRTNHPLRVVLLPQQAEGSETSISKPASTSRTSYSEPIHWDFAPEEGGTRGLILSLPDNNLSLRDGDILVAFAQDGSQRYWGPYVVGKTESPTWNTANKEWQLTLQP